MCNLSVYETGVKWNLTSLAKSCIILYDIHWLPAWFPGPLQKRVIPMICPKCGTELPNDAKECPQCGVRFVPGKYCPHCKSVMPADASVCPTCKRTVEPDLSEDRPLRGSFRWWRIPIYILVFALGIGVGAVGMKLMPIPLPFLPASAPVASGPDASQADGSVPTEYANALSQAETYSSTLHMSKQGIYDQLVAEDGGKFSAEAAQYAVDNLTADYNANALAKAKEYFENQNMSKDAVREQLVSENGEKFTQEEADYAIGNLE